MYIGLHVKYPLFLSDFCQILIIIKFSVQIFEKSSDIKFLRSLSSGSWVIPCGRWTDLTRLIVSSRNFANALTNGPPTLKVPSCCSTVPSRPKLIGCTAETECVYCAVRTKFLNIIQVNLCPLAISGDAISDMWRTECCVLQVLRFSPCQDHFRHSPFTSSSTC